MFGPVIGKVLSPIGVFSIYFVREFYFSCEIKSMRHIAASTDLLHVI